MIGEHRTWAELLDAYDDALISWRELDYDAQPRYEALRARIEAALRNVPIDEQGAAADGDEVSA